MSSTGNRGSGTKCMVACLKDSSDAGQNAGRTGQAVSDTHVAGRTPDPTTLRSKKSGRYYSIHHPHFLQTARTGLPTIGEYNLPLRTGRSAQRRGKCGYMIKCPSSLNRLNGFPTEFRSLPLTPMESRHSSPAYVFHQPSLATCQGNTSIAFRPFLKTNTYTVYTYDRSAVFVTNIPGG